MSDILVPCKTPFSTRSLDPKFDLDFVLAATVSIFRGQHFGLGLRLNEIYVYTLYFYGLTGLVRVSVSKVLSRLTSPP